MKTDGIAMMWDTAILTDRKIGANCPDICFRNRKTNTCLLIDISCPADGNIARKQAEKWTKYSDLRVKVSRTWQCQTVVVPVVLGALAQCMYSTVRIARWLDYSRSSQPAALIKTASWIQSDPS